MMELVWDLHDLGFDATVRFPLGRPDLQFSASPDPVRPPLVRRDGEVAR
jgi:hypothetical protein